MGFLQAFRPIVLDLLATIVFVIILKLTGNVVLATAFGIVAGLARFVWLKVKGRPVGPLQYVSVVLVIMSGAATIATNNAFFMEVKPSLVGLAVAVVMMSTNWLAPYLPPIVAENLEPGVIRWAGRLWGVLQLVLAVANAVVASKFKDLWPAYAAFVPGIANVLAFVVHYWVFRVMIGHRIRAREAAQAAA